MPGSTTCTSTRSATIRRASSRRTRRTSCHGSRPLSRPERLSHPPRGPAPSRSARTRLGALGWADPAPGLDLDPAVGLLLGGMLDEGDQPARHEPTGADRRAAAGHLADLHDTARRRDLEPATVLRRDDVERLGPLPRVDDDLDPISTHPPTIAPSNPAPWADATLERLDRRGCRATDRRRGGASPPRGRDRRRPPDARCRA